MSRTISPEKLTLRDLKEEFQLQMTTDAEFFLEWQKDLPVLSEFERQRLDRIYAIYINHNQDTVMEESLKILILSPFMDLADLFLPPFQFSAEEHAQISFRDENKTYRGRIDMLVLLDQMWVLVIESKRQALSLSVGIPQVLTYMVSNLKNEPRTNPLYGMVSNGSNFVFLKMVLLDGAPVYAMSDELLLARDSDRIQILQILKQLGRSLQV
jgi:hypothetical protein